MARALPKDIEAKIKGTAVKAESRSGFALGMMVGSALGFGLGAMLFGAISGSFFYLLGAASVLALWFMVSRRKKNKDTNNK